MDSKQKESQNYPYMCRNCMHNQYLKVTEKNNKKAIIINIYVEIVGTTKTSNGQWKKKPKLSIYVSKLQVQSRLEMDRKKAINVYICVEIVVTAET